MYEYLADKLQRKSLKKKQARHNTKSDPSILGKMNATYNQPTCKQISGL
jgi:hypothetical protein